MAKKKTSKTTAPKVIVNPTKSQLPPPPPPKKGPPPPPPPMVGRGATTDFRKVVANEAVRLPGAGGLHRPPPADVTHYEFVHKDGGTFIVGPASTWHDFAKTPGTMRYGKMLDDDAYRKGHQGGFRYHPDFEPENRRQIVQQDNLPGTEAAAGTTSPKPARAPSAGGKREGVCAFIDATIMEGGRTVAQILEVVMAKFPGRDAKATESTIRCRPSHIKKAGNTPPPFVK